MSSALQEERTILARPLLTHELGSLAKPNWRVKANAGRPIEDMAVRGQRNVTEAGQRYIYVLGVIRTVERRGGSGCSWAHGGRTRVGKERNHDVNGGAIRVGDRADVGRSADLAAARRKGNRGYRPIAEIVLRVLDGHGLAVSPGGGLS